VLRGRTLIKQKYIQRKKHYNQQEEETIDIKQILYSLNTGDKLKVCDLIYNSNINLLRKIVKNILYEEEENIV